MLRDELLLLPLLLQVLLTVALYLALAVAKARAVRRGEVDAARRALHEDAWPESVQKINNNIRNQFQVPVLFYVLVLVLWQLGHVGAAAHVLAWLFVASRLAHAWVHIHSNHVPTRRRLFMLGCVAVLALAVLATWRVLAQ